MLNHVTRNFTVLVKNRCTWKPSQMAVRTALSTLAGGSLVLLCTVPALAAASLKTGPVANEMSFQGLEFLAFIGAVAFAPLMILMSASVSRMVMLRAGWNNNMELSSFQESQPLIPTRDPSTPRQIAVPNSQFGSCKVELPIAELTEEIEV